MSEFRESSARLFERLSRKESLDPDLRSLHQEKLERALGRESDRPSPEPKED